MAFSFQPAHAAPTRIPARHPPRDPPKPPSRVESLAPLLGGGYGARGPGGAPLVSEALTTPHFYVAKRNIPTLAEMILFV